MNEIFRDLVFDIGMHNGEDTDFYLTKGYRVIGFEANPRLADECRSRFRDAIDAGRLILVEGAIGSADLGETIDFYIDENSVWGTVHEAWAKRNEMLGSSNELIKVNRVDMADAYRRFGVPFYMKVDIEGQDKYILDSMRKLDIVPQYMSVESEKVVFSDLQEEIENLRSLGYKKFKAVQQSTIPGTSISTKTIDGRSVNYVFQDCASGPFGDDLAMAWMSYDEIVERYKSIFRLYQVFGDYGFLTKIGPAGKIPRIAYKVLTGYRGELPGWYDTHASL